VIIARNGRFAQFLVIRGYFVFCIVFDYFGTLHVHQQSIYREVLHAAVMVFCFNCMPFYFTMAAFITGLVGNMAESTYRYLPSLDVVGLRGLERTLSAVYASVCSHRNNNQARTMTPNMAQS